MSAKLLMGLSEENPELERQIGCMTGIFQVFDRHHLVTGRRFSGQSPKRLPSGQSRSSSSTYTEECNRGSPQIVLEYNSNKSSKKNRRVSVEPSASLSSSPSSSFSSTKPKSSDIETKSTRNDFRDVVKDSINGETRVLAVKTSVKEDVKKDNVLKYRDSPRPIMSVDLNDSSRVQVRLKESPWNAYEVPRFSCDGREMLRSKSTTKLIELPRLSLDSRERSLQASNFDTKPKEIVRSSLNQRTPSVVAKLMGLEAMPSSASQEPTELLKPNIKKSGDSFYDGEKDRIMHSPKSSPGTSETRKLKNAGLVSKHISKQTESVYSQIEKRIKELEFPQSNKDLRALKHILDTMQAKGMLENKESKLTSEKNQNLKPADSQNPHITTPRAFESPIVIMKPAKSIKRSEDLEGLSGLRKLRTSDSASRRKAKEQTPSSEKRNEERISQKIQIPLVQRSPRPQQPVRERSGSPVKALSSSSPRVQQRKLEPEKKPPRPSARKKNANRKPLEPVLSNGNLRVKPNQAKIDDQQGKQADEISQRENGNISLATQPEDEVMDDDLLIIVNSPPYQQYNQKIQNEDSSSTDSAIVSVEQPSPISVLDTTFYQDDLPLSPVKKISCAIEDDKLQTSPEDCKIAISLVNTTPSKLSSEIHLQKLFGIKNLVEKLRSLCSTDDTDDHVSEILMSAGLQEENLQPKSKAERLHKELMFDVVKEILARKLELMSHGPQPDLFLRSKKLSGQNLLKELCSEIKQQLVKRPLSTSFEDEEEEDLAFREDLLRQSDGWEDFGNEVPGLVLEIERSIFKDLIDEVVTGEACSGLRAIANRRRNQLFV